MHVKLLYNLSWDRDCHVGCLTTLAISAVTHVCTFVQIHHGVGTDLFGQAIIETPLAHACGQGFLDIVELLIESGADVNYLCSVRLV